MKLKLEVIVLPVSDVDRAKEFYQRLGFREDADFPGQDGFRVVQLTPPGSPTSIMIGSGISDSEPGSVKGLHLIVEDVVAAREELLAAGAGVSEVFHDRDGLFHHAGTEARVAGPHPTRATYSSFLSFNDPDGNEFVLQEISQRLPGRITEVVYGSVAEVETALRDAAAAHGKHEEETGQPDAEWPAWYAAYMARAAGLEV